MADDVLLNPGTGGSVVATDDVAGKHYQRVKLVDGTADSTALIPGSAVDGLLVNLGANNDVVVSGPVTANAGTNLNTSALALESTLQLVKTAVEKADDFVVGVRGLVTEDNSAAIKTAVELIDDPVIVDDAAFTPAASKVMMVGFEFDNVTPDSVDEGDAGAARMSANRNQYVQIRDSSGAERGLNIDANGEVQISGSRNPIPITDNAGSVTVDAPVGTPAYVRLSDGAAAISTLPVSLASVPSHAVTNAGTFVTQENGGVLISAQLLDDVVVADDAAFTPATTKVSMAGFEFDDVTPDSVDEGDAGAARMSANRNIYTRIRDNAGNERGLNVDANGEIGIGAIRAALPAGANAIGKLAANGGVVIGDVNLVSAIPAGANAIGKLAANSGVVIGDVNIVSAIPGVGATSLGKAEDAAAASGDVGIAILGKRTDVQATLQTSADGDYGVPAIDGYGAQWMRQGHPNAWSYHLDTSTAQTDTTVKAAPAAGLSIYVTDIVVSLGAATALNAFLEEGTTTKVLGPFYLEGVVGRGIALQFQTPKKITANTALTLTTSASVAHAVDIQGFIAP